MKRRNFILGGIGAVAIGASAGAWSFIHRPEFGRLPQGERLQRMLQSPHYSNGQFHNLVPVQVMTNKSGESKFTATWKFLFGDKTGLFPPSPLPAEKTDFHALKSKEDVILWLGHSSIYLQLNGMKILLDPVLSNYASPLFFINKAFPGSNIYTPQELPDIDVLAISHDHWDHLDYPTVMALKGRVKKILCPLGVGEYFQQWGFPVDTIMEGDWWDEFALSNEVKVWLTPSQHFSGRFLDQNPTLWCGFVFSSPGRTIYYSGDGGYGEHFKEIGKRFKNTDVAIMENGQYNLAWHPIHMLPEETAQAAADVGAKRVIPMHNGKFALARHKWYEPYEELWKASQDKPYKLLTPVNGEAVYLDGDQEFYSWWKSNPF